MLSFHVRGKKNILICDSAFSGKQLDGFSTACIEPSNGKKEEVVRVIWLLGYVAGYPLKGLDVLHG